VDIDFDLSSMGFEMAEVDLLLDPPKKNDPADAVEEPDDARPPVTQAGDLWLLGGHRLLAETHSSLRPMHA